MALNSSGPISLGGSTTGQSINLEIGQTATQTISLNQTAVRAVAGRTVAGSSVAVPTDFYGKYYNYLTASSSAYSTYNFVSQQGGLQNGGGSCLAGGNPSYITDINGGWRVGNPFYPTSANGSSPCQWWTVNLNANTFSDLSTMYTLLSSGAASAMWSNVTWVSNVGTTQSFTAVLNSGYYGYMNNSATGSKALMNPGTTYTFYMDTTQTGIGIGTAGRSTGTTYLSMFTADGGLWTNNTGAPGTINVICRAVGQGKLGNFRVTIDGTVVYTGGNGDSGCGGKDYGDVTVGPFNITATSTVLVEEYWWGCGNFQYGVNYITGGSWKIGATLTHV